jgi:hypothetical protein
MPSPLSIAARSSSHRKAFGSARRPSRSEGDGGCKRLSGARGSPAAIQSQFPFAIELISGAELPTEFVDAAVSTPSNFAQDRLSAMADALLEQSAKAIGYRGGEYMTPESLRNLMIGLAEPVGSVYNPATGIGQLMVDVAIANKATTTEADFGTRLTGQEVDSSIWAMAQLNLCTPRPPTGRPGSASLTWTL